MYDIISGPDLKKVLLRISMFGISMPMMILGLKYFPPSLPRAASSLQPVWSAILGYFIVGEAISRGDLATIATSLFAVFLITK
jgi:drug/metabolite transporter (DMT)-like permease